MKIFDTIFIQNILDIFKLALVFVYSDTVTDSKQWNRTIPLYIKIIRKPNE